MNKIVIPVELQTRLIEWYHEQLLDTGILCLIKSIKQRFHWKTMTKDIANFTKTCKDCQIFFLIIQHYPSNKPKITRILIKLKTIS